MVKAKRSFFKSHILKILWKIIYYKATIYRSQHDVIVEEYTEPDAIGQLNIVYQFIDKQSRCGEYCISDTLDNVIQGLIVTRII